MTIRLCLLAGVALSLAACDNGPSAVSTRERGGALETARPDATTPSFRADDRGGGAERPHTARARAEVAAQDDDLGGGLKWAANRRYSADDNAHYQFERRAADFGVSDFKAYVAKADEFVAHPPKGVLTVERSNGDVLFYDPKTNVFAVADRSGAPRTMFKPPAGQAYWEQQKARLDRGDRQKDGASDDGEKS